jgi:hypothetical protein
MLSPSQEPQKSSHTPPQAAGKSITISVHSAAQLSTGNSAIFPRKYPAPVRSVEEQTKHDRVQIDGAVEHFRQSGLPKNSN